MSFDYNFVKDQVDIEQLIVDINNNNNIANKSFFATIIGNNDITIKFNDELDINNITELTTVVNNHNPSGFGDKNYSVKTYENRLLQNEMWWNEYDILTEIYSGWVEKVIYNYTNNRLISYTITIYYIDGTFHSEETYKYFQEGELIKLRKVI